MHLCVAFAHAHTLEDVHRCFECVWTSSANVLEDVVWTEYSQSFVANLQAY